MEEAKAGGQQDWWVAGLAVSRAGGLQGWQSAGLVGCRSLQMLQFRYEKQELRLLLAVHPLPHSQFPAHRPFLFCCELQFPWVHIKA